MDIISTVILTIGLFTVLGCWAAAVVMIRNDVFGDRSPNASTTRPAADEQPSVRELATSGAR